MMMSPRLMPTDDPLMFGRPGVALGHSLLHGNRTGDSLNDARELNEDAVARRLDDAAFMFGDLWIDEFTAMGSEAL
jgi:hypothetical protein